jgi:hypothetical protein
MNITYGTILHSRQAIIAHITAARAENPAYRVIDLGGVAGGGWSNEYCDMIVDINAGSDDPWALRIDLCRVDSWAPLWADIEANGLYDFAICNHTLEDLYNPYPVLDNLHKIARRGMITTPSINTELAHLPESPEYKGYLHHRWLFDQTEDGHLLVIPKLGIIERSDLWPAHYHEALQEIRYEWTAPVNYVEFGDNYIAGKEHYLSKLNSVWAEFAGRVNSS